MNVLEEKRIAVIGVGNIGRIWVKRLCETGFPPESIFVSDVDAARMEAVVKEFGVCAADLHDVSFPHADILLIATSPKNVRSVLHTLADHLQPGQIVISLAAAVSLEQLEAWVPAEVSVIRVMPNAPSIVGEGMNPVAYGRTIPRQARELVEVLLGIMGQTIEVQDDQMNWCVGLSGAAMRSLVPVLEGLTKAGMDAGLSDRQARRVAAQVMLGTAKLVLQTDLTWEEIKTLTPMQTVDEVKVMELFYDAARTARETIEGVPRKLQEMP